MADYERTIIRFSLDDVIHILEHEPVQPDMVPEITVSRIMNRGPVAHLSMERALKFLIEKANQPWNKHHNLHTHLEELRKHDPNSVVFLEKAFDDAVQHYRINPNYPDKNHFKSLVDYLAMTGSESAFNNMRYWELKQSLDEDLIRRLSLQIHYEILHAMREAVVSPGQPSETVKDRIERALEDAILPANEMDYIIGSGKQESVDAYVNWVLGYETNEYAFAEAFQKDFKIGDEFMNSAARQAFETLAIATDPAVKYLACVLSVLSRQERDAKPCVEWLGPEQFVSGRVHTPGGTTLEHIQRGPDGIWDIIPATDGLVRISARASSQTDARCYLANTLTTLGRLKTNGAETELRIVDIKYRMFRRTLSISQAEQGKGDIHTRTITVIFWDDNHGLIPEQEVKIVQRKEGRMEQAVEGTVTNVSGPEVQVTGYLYYRVKNEATQSELTDGSESISGSDEA